MTRTLMIFAITILGTASLAAPVESVDPDIATLHVLRDYDTHKNSFVLGQETYADCPLRVPEGQRKTLLDVSGPGSLRHIWTTCMRVRGSSGPPYLLEIFVDGETKPSIRGAVSDLVSAASRCEQPFVGMAGSVAPRRSYNWYLPIPFEKSLRVDLIATEPMRFIFMQWDYRSGDDSMKGIRLVQHGEGKATRLEYTGLGDRFPKADPLPKSTLRKEQFILQAGQPAVVRGPGIIRHLAVDKVPQGAKLRIRFDGEKTAAVDADAADFFGPYKGTPIRKNECLLPMPMRRQAEIEMTETADGQPVTLSVDIEPVERFEDNWAYFHAKSYREASNEGWLPMPVLCTSGRGHWVGMSLYDTGSNHGGGDFALIDGDSDRPLLLHGINGEDYFSFAWHADGQNLPYSEAISRKKGRVRFHLENPYVFHRSLEVAWSVLQKTSPRSVTYWYQDSPKDLTRTGRASQGLLWEVFGPVDIPTTQDGNTPDVTDRERLFAALPSAADLDAGKPAEARHTLNGRHKGTFKGWARQYAVGPHLNMTYVYRHVVHIGSKGFLGSEPRAMMASTRLVSAMPRDVTLQLSYDDPLEVQLNGQLVHADVELHDKLVTRNVKVKLAKGENRLLLKMVDTPNANNSWAGIVLRVLDSEGRDISALLQAPRQSPRGMYFAKKKYVPHPLPQFDKTRDKLPSPIYDENPTYVRMYWKTWEIAFKNFYEPTPGSGYVSQFIDAAFNRNIFQWDTCFLTMFCNYAHPLVPGIASLDNFYIKQYDDGEILRETDRKTGKDFQPWVNKDRIGLYTVWRHSKSPAPLLIKYVGREAPQPPPYLSLDALNHPIFAWAELESLRVTGDKDRVALVYPPLVKYYAALKKYIRQGNGLYMTDWASMDNSPRISTVNGGGTAVDTSSEMALFAEQLGKMASLLGKEEEAAAYRRDAEETAKQINKFMWDPEQNFYYDLTVDGKRGDAKTIAAYWTLLAGVASEEQADALASHLKNPKTFGRKHRVPTCSADLKEFNPKGGYWRGSVWAPTNTMVIRGLERYGKNDLAKEIACEHLDCVTQVFKKTGTVWENYAPDSIAQGKPAKRDFVGWTGIVPILYFIEYRIGLSPDALNNRLDWTITSDQRCGCERFRFNGHVATLVATPNKDRPSALTITVDSDGAFDLHVKRHGKEWDLKVEKGKNTFELDEL